MKKVLHDTNHKWVQKIVKMCWQELCSLQFKKQLKARTWLDTLKEIYLLDVTSFLVKASKALCTSLSKSFNFLRSGMIEKALSNAKLYIFHLRLSIFVQDFMKKKFSECSFARACSVISFEMKCSRPDWHMKLISKWTPLWIVIQFQAPFRMERWSNGAH